MDAPSSCKAADYLTHYMLLAGANIALTIIKPLCDCMYPCAEGPIAVMLVKGGVRSKGVREMGQLWPTS